MASDSWHNINDRLTRMSDKNEALEAKVRELERINQNLRFDLDHANDAVKRLSKLLEEAR